MTRLFLSILLSTCFFATWAWADSGDWVREDNNIRVPMRDGKHLAAKLLLPAKRGRYPAILVQTPYDKNRMGSEFAGQDREARRGSKQAWAQFDRNNYAYLFVDWRGFHASKPAMRGVDKRRWKRGQDGFDAVEWIAKQPWCDGKVGTWGGSALGKAQLDTIIEHPPHLVCAVPLIANQGFRYETYYQGGVPIAAIIKGHDRMGFGVGGFVDKHRLPGRLWDFAQRRSYRPERINVPCLLISGWWDNYPGAVVQQFNDILDKGIGKARESKLIMGPWSHIAVDISEQGDLRFPKAENWSTRVTLKFFDYYLRGIGRSSWEAVPAVNLFQTQEGRWVGGRSWDALLGQATTYHLHPTGRIADDRPSALDLALDSTRRYRYDPKNPSPSVGGRNLPPLSHGPKEVSRIAARKDLLVYRTDVLTAALAVRGVVTLSLSFICNRVDTDIHVRLCDEDGRGRSHLVGETILRAKLRDGRSVQLLTPGQTYRVTLRFDPHAYTWTRGNRLALIVTGGSAPRYEPNSHTGADRYDARKAQDVEVQVLHGADHPSQLSLPLVRK